jgi:hypothetical protein
MLFYQCDSGSLSPMISYRILQGNSYDVVRRLLPYSIGKYRVIITSPPYYGQRYYGQASLTRSVTKKTPRHISKNWRKFLRHAEIFLVMTVVSGLFAVFHVGIMENS